MAIFKKNISLLLAILFAASLSACGGTDVGNIVAGWHFQGRDCLSCHMVDLQAQRHLTVAGTVFKAPSVNDLDDLNNVCNGNLRLQFLDTGMRVAFDSQDYEDQNSKGYKGKGNIFILNRKLASIQGLYFIKLLAEDGTLLAQSGIHQFTSSFDRNNPADINNRYSCNACHSLSPSGTAPGLIYPTINTNRCN